MGIKDLLKFVKPHVEPIHIKKYAGKRVGIDAYSWLHKGAYSCSMELTLNMEGDKKFQYLNYCMHRINLLRYYKITPVVVFDGMSIPCKATTDHDRARRRNENRDLAMAKLKEGNARAAVDHFQRAVSITPAMAHQLIQILRSENIEFVVAPYEADAQLAYLSTLEAGKGGIVAVISEDSDLLAYGCPAVVFKMDRYGNGEEIVLNKVFESANRMPSFRNFDTELFTGMCVFAGCDFLPSVPGIGIVKAYSLVSKYRSLERALSILKFEKGNLMPEDYSKSFKEAVAVFQHALIYDARSKSLKQIKPLPEKLLQDLDTDLDFLGPLTLVWAVCFVVTYPGTLTYIPLVFQRREIPQSMAIAIAEGKLDPTTMEAFDHFPRSGVHLKPTIQNPTSDGLLQLEATILPTTDSCFTVISSQKSRKEIVEVTKQNPLMEESKYSNEATELEKLVRPLNAQPTEDNKMSATNTPLKVPDNNPFRKRKLNEVQLPDQAEIASEQVPVLTEIENSQMLYATPESQKSVDSKPINVVDAQGRAKTDKARRSNWQGPENKRGSILNFFSRV